MASSINIIDVLRVLGKKVWTNPKPYSPDGWAVVRQEDGSSIIITVARHEDGNEWVHASIAHKDRTPTYDELALLHKAVFQGKGWAYQVFAPDTDHVNIHPFALHLWGRLDGTNPIPNFGKNGSI